MAEVTQLKRYDAPRINWGKWFLIGTGMLVSAFILLVPMIYIFVQAFSKGLMPVLHNLADPEQPQVVAPGGWFPQPQGPIPAPAPTNRNSAGY